MPEKQLILALDIGSSSVRASLYTDAAKPVRGAAVRVERSFAASRDGGSVLDADAAVDDVIRAIDELLAKTEDIKGDITHIAASAFWHSIVGVDAKGRPTTKVLGWADTRSREFTAKLKKKFDEAAVHDRTGAHFHSSYWPAKLLWLQKESKAVFDKTSRWLSFSDLVLERLTGVSRTSISMASGTGIFNIHTLRWDAPMMKALKIKPDHLTPVTVSDDESFALTKKFQERWPRLKAAKMFPAIADGAADNVGSGCTTKQKAALMIGTSGAMRIVYKGDPPKHIPAGIWCYRVDRRRTVIGGALSNGGNLYAWMIKNLRLPKNAEDLAAERPNGAKGVTFMPYLAGERSTGYNEDAKGAILGLTMANDAIDILQAGLEAVAAQFADIHSRLKKVANIREIYASGGALHDSPVWTAMISAAIGKQLELTGIAEASSCGVVLLALETLGKIDDIG